MCILLVNKYPTYKIINYDKLDYCSSLKNLESIEDAPNYEFVHGDILATDLVNYIIRKERVDTIMHFAAQSHVGEHDACRGCSHDTLANRRLASDAKQRTRWQAAALLAPCLLRAFSTAVTLLLRLLQTTRSGTR